MPLTLDYRPKTFSDVVGQSHVLPILRAYVEKNTPPPVITLAGVSGSGKTSCARIYAAALNCSQMAAGDACGVCESCVEIQNNASDAVIEIDAASNGGVDNIRSIREMCLYAHSRNWRVVVIDEAQALSSDSFRALLKLFEEPPPQTVFFLLTTEPEAIPRPVQSRSVPFEYRSIPLVDIAKRLHYIAKDIDFPISPILCARIATVSEGQLRDAVIELEKCYQKGIVSDEEYLDLSQRVDVALPLMASVAYGDVKGVLEKVDDFFSTTSDLKKFLDQISEVFVSLSRAYVGVPSSSGVVELAHMFSKPSLLEGYSLLWDAYSKVNTSHSPKIVAQLFVQNLITAMSVKTPEPVDIVEKPAAESIIVDNAEISVEEAFALLD